MMQKIFDAWLANAWQLCVSARWENSHTQCTSLNLTPFPLLQCVTAAPLRGHSSHLLKAQPPPLLWLHIALSVSSLVWFFVDFHLAQLPFSLPKPHNENNPSYCHPFHLSFLLPTLNFLLEICFTQLATLNFNHF